MTFRSRFSIVFNRLRKKLKALPLASDVLASDASVSDVVASDLIDKTPNSAASEAHSKGKADPASSKATTTAASNIAASTLTTADAFSSSSVIDILIIDDDPLVLVSLQRLLRSRGYRVSTASDAIAGLQTAIRLTPSVIICDWLLPGDLSGLDICHRIKQDPQLSTIAVIMMTSHTDIANRVEALEAGADDLLIKPVDTAALIARVKSGLRIHQLTQELRSQTRRLETELSEAATYVKSLLPEDVPPESGQAVAIASRFISSQELGGDCFDHYWLDPDYLVMYLLDVSGHGLGAALLSTSVLNVLRSQSLPGVNFYRPESVLKGLNEAFQMDNQGDKYFTIWYGVYNQATQELSYASAGHPPAALLTLSAIGNDHSATCELLRTPGMPIGMMPDTLYEWQRTQITTGSRLYVFSDGIYEIQPDSQFMATCSVADSQSQTVISHTPYADYLENPQQLGLDGFVHILQSLAQHQVLNLDSLIEQVSQFGGNRFDDDLSLLEITFK